MRTGTLPNWKVLLMPIPIGTVQTLPLSCSQLAMMLGAAPIEVTSSRL